MAKSKSRLWENRSWLFRLSWPITNYLLANFSVTIGYIFFHFFNRTIVIGKRNVPLRTNTLLLSNHQTMIDSFLIGMFAFYPNSLIKPSVIPWNPAAEENFYRNSFLAWVADNWKCIPIKKGRKDVGAIFKMADALRNGTMILFPEGTRSRDGSIGKARGGAGLLILETRPTVVPVCIEGMDELLPVGAVLPRLFKRVYIYYGKPLDLSEYYGREKCRDVAQEIMHLVMERIRTMRAEIQGMKAYKKAYEGKPAILRD